jgi:hypothetical protein
MHRRMISTSRLVSTAAAVTLATGLAVGAAPVAFAADNCAAYGSQCPSVAPTTLSATPTVKGTTLTKEPSTLPFTGGEFVLMGSAGAIALGAGSALVLASRRRRSTPTA